MLIVKITKGASCNTVRVKGSSFQISVLNFVRESVITISGGVREKSIVWSEAVNF